jgi:galactonate dehydratase
MRIRDVQIDMVHVNHRGDWVFVRVLTDEGIEGVGELRAGRNYDDRLTATRELADFLIGRDPGHIQALAVEVTARTGASGPGLFAWSACEQALWDILGKSTGVPIHKLFGGPCRGEIRLYANINRATTDRTPAGFARNAASAVSEGFDAVKLAPFDGLAPDVDDASEAQHGIRCMQAVRDAIGPDVDLLIDCHCRFTAKGALSVAGELRDLDLYWYEQPTPESDLEAVKSVKNACGMTTAGGEQRTLRPEWRDVLAQGAMDVIMPDVTVVGGIQELKKIGEMAEAWHIPTAPHGPFGPISLAAGAQAMAAHPGFLILEYAWGEVPWRPALTEPSEDIRGGRLVLSDQPGLGLTLSPDTVAAHRVA